MTLTAKDIQSQQFHVRFRGFDVEEVDDFLEKLATAMEAANQENARLKEQVTSLEKELAAYQGQAKSFQAAIIAAQKIADEMKEKSRQEAEELLARARGESARIQQDANAEVTGLEQEVDRLKALRSKVQNEMRQLLRSYLDQLESTPPEPDSEGLPRPEPVPPRRTAAAEAEPFGEELSDDLYVKIDLPDSGLIESTDELTAQDVRLPLMPDTEFLDVEEEEHSAPHIPELEGDMVFSLEDPLDAEHNGPAVVLDEDEEAGGGRKK